MSFLCQVLACVAVVVAASCMKPSCKGCHNRWSAGSSSHLSRNVFAFRVWSRLVAIVSNLVMAWGVCDVCSLPFSAFLSAIHSVSVVMLSPVWHNVLRFLLPSLPLCHRRSKQLLIALVFAQHPFPFRARGGHHMRVSVGVFTDGAPLCRPAGFCLKFPSVIAVGNNGGRWLHRGFLHCDGALWVHTSSAFGGVGLGIGLCASGRLQDCRIR